MMIRRFFGFSLLIVLVVLAGCGGGDETTDPGAPTGAPTATLIVGPRDTVFTPIPPAPEWVEAAQVISAENIRQIRLLGRLDAPGAPSTVFDYAFSPDGTRLAGLNNDFLLLWDLIDGSLVANNTRQRAAVAYYSPEKDEIYGVAIDGTTLAFDADEGTVLTDFSVHPDYSGASVYHADLGRLAVGGMWGDVKVWDPVERVSLVTIDTETTQIVELALSADGTLLATADLNGVVKVWRWAERALVSTIDQGGVGVTRMVFSPDGTRLAVGRSTSVEIWQVAESALLHSLQTERGGTSGVLRYSPDGRYLLSGGQVPDMTLWDAETGEAFARLTELGGERVSAAFSPDGTLLLTASIAGKVSLWEMASGSRYDLDVGTELPLFVDWSPDGFVMIFVDARGPIYVWGVGAEALSD